MASPTIGEQIVQAMVNALATPGSGTPPGKVYRNRQDAFESNELPAFAIYSVEEKAVRQSEHVTERIRTIALECLVSGQPPQDQAADPLIAYAVNTLFQDPTLSDPAGLLRYLDQTEIIWQTEPGEEDACIARILFDVKFTTLAQDPTQVVT